jgi:hypothetical protein
MESKNRNTQTEKWREKKLLTNLLTNEMRVINNLSVSIVKEDPFLTPERRSLLNT